MLEVITADIGSIDGCPILTRTKAFIVSQGSKVILEHVIRDRQGVPRDLTDYLGGGSDSSDSTGTGQGSVYLRFRELVSPADPSRNPVIEITAEATDPAKGVIRAEIGLSATDNAGVYDLSWGVRNSNGDLVLSDNSLLSVERSLYASDPQILIKSLGPPTINQIRMALMDSSAGENLLLDDIEFSTDQIAYAISRPIQSFNESPPPIQIFDSRNFPWPENWLKAITGHLLVFAAHNYRRNRLPYSAGGLTIDDKNKEREYLSAGRELLQGWEQFTVLKKVELNIKGTSTFIGSDYGSYDLGV